MRQLTEEDRQTIREEVETEFPGDPMMQELHTIRLARYYELKDLPLKEQIRHRLRTVRGARSGFETAEPESDTERTEAHS